MSTVQRMLTVVVVAALAVGGAAASAIPATGQESGSEDPAANERVSCDPGKQTNLGAATEAAPIVGGQLVDDTAYTVSRGLDPALLASLDMTSGEVTETIEIPTGAGAWASTVSDGDLYIGTYSGADLYRHEPGSAEVERVASFPADTFVFDADAAPDGAVALGTYPTASVRVYDPEADEVRDYGSVTDQVYVRSVAATDDTIYAGIGASAELVAVDRDSGETQDLTPPEFAGESFVYDLEVTDDLIVAGTEPSGYLAVIDRDDPDDYEVVETGGRTVDATAVVGATVFATTRDDGALVAYDLDGGELEKLAVPSPGEETRELFVDNNRLVGFAGSGAVWTYDLEGGDVELIDLIEAGHPAEAEPPQSIATSDRMVHVAGHWNVTRHRTPRGDAERMRIPGEAKAMVDVDGTMYAALYPGARVWAYESEAAEPEPRSVTTIGEGQNRPLDIAHSDAADTIAIGTRPDYGRLGGALSLLDAGTEETTTYRDVIADQSISAVAWSEDGEFVYLGSSIAGGIGSVPVADEAHLAAWDVEAERLVWEVAPVEGVGEISDIEVLDGRLAGVAADGTAFSVDSSDGEVLETGQLPAAMKLAAAGTSLYASDANDVLRLDPVSLATEELATDLMGNSYSGNALATEDPCGVYTLTGRDLLRVSVKPHKARP